MNEPTWDDIKAASKFPPLLATEDDPDGLRLADEANSAFLRFTGLVYANIAATDDASVFRAVRGLAELSSVQESADYIETLSDWDLIQSFSAGPYSETRRSADDARKARLLVAWPWLSDLLWDLMTDDRRDHYLELLGVPVPAFEVSEMDWSWSWPDTNQIWGG